MSNGQSKGASKRKSTSTWQSSLRMFCVGALAGIFLCLACQWLLLSSTPTTSPENPQASAEISIEPESTEEARQPDIDFYERLRDSEVLIPVPTIIEPQEREAVQYFLQAASFKNEEDAKRARAEVLLLNLEATVTEFEINGQLWHRIIVGPFEGQSRVSKAQTTLLENGYGGMVLQRKK